MSFLIVDYFGKFHVPIKKIVSLSFGSRVPIKKTVSLYAGALVQGPPLYKGFWKILVAARPKSQGMSEGHVGRVGGT